MGDTFLWAQGLGLIAMAIGLCAWQMKNPKKIMLTLAGSDGIWAIQYLLLGAHTGGALLIGTFIRNSCSAFLSAQKMKYVLVGYLCLAIGITIFTYKAWFDILPFIGTLIFSLSLLKKDQRSIVARASIIGNISWTTYALLSHSYLGAFYGLFIMVSSLIGMYRHENWVLGKCFKTFPPSFMRSLFVVPSFRTYP